MLSFIYLLRQLDRRLVAGTIILASLWGIIMTLNSTTTQQLEALQAQYPLAQQWRLSQQCDAVAWRKLQESATWTRSRLRAVIQFLVQQFDLELNHIRIDEAQPSGLLQSYPIAIVVGSRTDAEIMEFLRYVEHELFPLASVMKFSLHRSRTLDESMLQNGQEIHLVEGRLELVWISK